MHQAFIALGSNLNNPIKQIKDAFVSLGHIPHTRVLKQSSLYQTAPMGYDEVQMNIVPDFINAVALVETELTPQSLLEALFEIENLAGRQRPYPNAPRILDCDLLLFENTLLDTEKLTLPHPRMHTRGFVLLPLFEIAPHLSIPNHGKIETLMQNVQYADVRKLQD